jgi:lon-related putative ATP-dependent protease
MLNPLSADLLRNVCTDELLLSLPDRKDKGDEKLIDQHRAEEALKLGLGIKASGFNIFVAGEEGTGKLTVVKLFLETVTKNTPTPDDWCYVHNFSDPYRPATFKMPPGMAKELKKDMKAFVGEAMLSLIKVFESEQYAEKRQEIKEKYDAQQSALTLEINKKAADISLLIRQTPLELYTVPLKDGSPISDEDFDKLSVEEKQIIQDKQTHFSGEIDNILQLQRKLEKEATNEFVKLENEVAAFAINQLIAEIKSKYMQLQDVVRHLNALRDDILTNLTDFMLSHKDKLGGAVAKGNDYLKRYEVNILVDNTDQKGTPIVIVHNPNYTNLVGAVEKESVMGTLVTDFTMIRKGAMHDANGGYLIIRVQELLKNYFSWEALKRAIRNKEIVIDEAMDQFSYMATRTLKPDPIPLDVKVILVGSPFYYSLLYNYDNDFKSLFKVKADFNNEMERNLQNTATYIAFFTRLAAKEELGVADAGALRKLVEFGSRYAQHQQKLSTRFGKIADVFREAGHYAQLDNTHVITETHVQKAIEQKEYRSNLLQHKINDLIHEKHLLIDIGGSKIGQVNALAVMDLGDIVLGKPTRITCTVNLGKAGVVAIEREAELSGPIHTKGVLILTGFLSEKYFQFKPVSLSARLVFEQSYAEVEGDSASSTELYALLSSLSGLPIRQGIAVTGSVNQKGEVQAIGGLNEKIEGYFELCKLIGLNGEQGVMIPASNVQNLMLKEEVVEAVRQGNFHVWAVDTIDQGIELLTGTVAGSEEIPGTVHFLVHKTLNEFAERIKWFSEDEEAALRFP